MNPNDLNAFLEQKLLDVENFAMRIGIPEEELRSCYSLTTLYDDSLASLLMVLHTRIHTDKLDSQTFRDVATTSHAESKTWWDHFKKDHLNSWYLKPLFWYRLKRGLEPYDLEFIVREVSLEVTVNPMVLFPDLAKKYPAFLGRSFKYYTVREVIHDDRERPAA